MVLPCRVLYEGRDGVSRAQFAGENLVHNLGQIKNGHVKEFIRRRFVFDSLEDGGDAQGKMFGQEDINLPQPHPIQRLS